MPWRLDGLVEERLERCRALLADPSSEHHGSADMLCWVEYADMIVALHRAALDDGCRPRRDLSPAEKLQAGCGGPGGGDFTGLCRLWRRCLRPQAQTSTACVVRDRRWCLPYGAPVLPLPPES
jgi:hypothetical protein